MYESHFGISGPPFQLNPDPAFWFESAGQAEALRGLQRSLHTASAPVVVLSGEIGCGKSMLLERWLSLQAPGSLAAARLFSTQLGPGELADAVAAAFGLACETGDPVAPDAFAEHLEGLARQGRRPLLLIDEAQNLPPEGLALIGDWAQASAEGRMPLRICLAGQPELRSQLAAAAAVHLQPHIGASLHLEPLDAAETQAYIEHRLRHVGWRGRPTFERAAHDALYEFSAGVPRRINVVCNRLMLSAFLTGATTIDADRVAQTAADLLAEQGSEGRLPRNLPGLTRAVRRSTEAGIWMLVGGRHDEAMAAALLQAMARQEGLPALTFVRASRGASAAGALVEPSLAARWLELGVPDPCHGQGPSETARQLERLLTAQAVAALMVFNGSPIALAAARLAQRRAMPVVHVGGGLSTSAAEGAAAASRGPTDRLADLIYTPEPEANDALQDAGIPLERAVCMGNVLVDALRLSLARERGGAGLRRETLAVTQASRGYGLVVLGRTLRRGGPVLAGTLAMLRQVSLDLPLIWPVDPDALAALRGPGRFTPLAGERIHTCAVLSYPLFSSLLDGAVCVLTDSWAVQEEAAALGVPCIALGSGSPRPRTVAWGCVDRLIDDPRLATRLVWRYMFAHAQRPATPASWDGQAALRVARHLAGWYLDPHGREKRTKSPAA